MEEEKKGFVVKDRRTFDESGKTWDEEATKQDPVKQGADIPGEIPDAAEEPAGEGNDYVPEVTFAGFILSLSTTALYHFGDFPDPATKKAEKNLAAAKQMIDTLSLLEAKTRGNLDQDEKNLVDGVLYELRMRYIKEKA
jgi:hypothetical protein